MFDKIQKAVEATKGNKWTLIELDGNRDQAYKLRKYYRDLGWKAELTYETRTSIYFLSLNRSHMSKIVLDIQGLYQWFPAKDGSRNHVLHNIDLKIAQGQFVAMVGSSGCGKSTLLRAILGTHPQQRGQILVSGMPVNGPNRHVGIVYQHYSLYDFLTVEKNVAVGPLWDKTNIPQRMLMPWFWWPLRKKHLQESRELLKKLKLGHVLGHYPDELSGGMRQRVAIAQALIMKPKLLLLDEPFGALDEATREDLQKMLLHLYQENLQAKAKGEDPPWTVIIITHELEEALYVSDRLIGLSKNWYDGRSTGDEVGATKIYDKASPVFHPDDPKDKHKDVFTEMKEEIRRVVLESKERQLPTKHVTFWDEAEGVVAHGVEIKTVDAPA